MATPMVDTPRVRGMAMPETAVEVAAPEMRRV
jgi:hypothetical protein